MVALNPAVDLARVRVELDRDLGHIAAGRTQQPFNLFAPDGFLPQIELRLQRWKREWIRRGCRSVGMLEMPGLDGLAVGQQRGGTERVLELAHVAAEAPGEQLARGERRDLGGGETGVAEQVASKVAEVFAPAPQRRQP